MPEFAVYEIIAPDNVRTSILGGGRKLAEFYGSQKITLRDTVPGALHADLAASSTDFKGWGGCIILADMKPGEHRRAELLTVRMISPPPCGHEHLHANFLNVAGHRPDRNVMVALYLCDDCGAEIQPRDI